MRTLGFADPERALPRPVPGSRACRGGRTGRDASRPNGEGVAAGIGFLGARSYPVAAALVLLYGLLI
jgi:hypothetical protein